MLSDHVYNLMEQIVDESKSLWRIDKYYKQEAGHCDQCREFWEKLADEKATHVAKLEELIRKHLS